MKRYKTANQNTEKSKISISTTSVLESNKKLLKTCPTSSSSSSNVSKTAFMVPAGSRYEKKYFCEKSMGKKICHSIELQPPFKTDKMEKCHPIPQDPSYMKIFRKQYCSNVEELKMTTNILKKESVCTCSKTSSMEGKVCSCTKTPTWEGKSLSHKLKDTQHKASTKPISRINGSQWKAPCKASRFDEREDYFIGKCNKEQLKRIPPKRPNWRPEFNLTEDPRMTQCLRNPKEIEEPKNPEDRYKEITEKIKLADNVDTPSISEESNTICIEMDLDNPIGLDYQGRDYKNTYVNDEQNIEDQKEYMIEKRHVERRQLKKQIAAMIDDELYKEKVATPKFFDIMVDYNSTGDVYDTESIHIVGTEKKELPEDTARLAGLFRTQDKAINIAITEMEQDGRYGRYHNLYLTKMEKDSEEKAKEAKAVQIEEENFIFDTAQKDLDDFINEKVVEIKAKFDSVPKIERRKWYPHNLREAKHLRHKMKKSKRIIRDKAILKKEFFKNQGYDKAEIEADLIIDADTTSVESSSEQSTDDEDDISVGPKEPDKYLLRGFHFKLGSEPRGKLHITQKRQGGRALRTCQTRTEWFDSLAPETREAPFYQYNPPTAPKNQSPDDPKLQLFPPEKPGLITCDESPIKQFIEEEIGIQYKKSKGKTVKVKKPKYVKVKKFNLTGYLFGAKEGNIDPGFMTSIVEGSGFGQLNEYMRSQIEKREKDKRRQRRQRMRYLGIPVSSEKQRKKIESCVDIKSEDSDWIPELEHIKTKQKFDDNLASKIKMHRSGHARLITGPVLYVHNMPAPEFREPTLRRHPRRPRMKDGNEFTLDRLSDNFVVPCLVAPEDDKIIPFNLKERETEYTHIFDARHHHDHIEPTQHKAIRVRYNPKIPAIVTEQKQIGEVEKTKKVKTFEKALPQGPAPGKFVDLSIPKIQSEKVDIKLNVNKKEHNDEKYSQNMIPTSQNEKVIPSRQRSGGAWGKAFPEYLKVQSKPKIPVIVTEEKQTGKVKTFKKAHAQGPKPAEFVDLSIPNIQTEKLIKLNVKSKEPSNVGEAHSQNTIPISSDENIIPSRQRGGATEKVFPGFLKVIKDMAKEMKKRLENVEDTEEHYVIDKEAYLNELQDELQSINSCVTSLESSICTNFTNDSGSFLMVQDMKIPLDYIRKSLVPFEEIDRTRLKASTRNPNATYYYPYLVVPFAGQKLEQIKMTKGKTDQFFTFSTRIRNGLRRRLEVEPVNLKNTPIGTDKIQALAQVATDLDENYMKDLQQSVSMKNFSVKSSLPLVKVALRKQFEIWYMNSQIVEQQIAEKKEEEYAAEILKLQRLFNKLFTKWEKKEYDRSMGKVRMVKIHYEATAFLKKELAEAEKNSIRLNMRIVFTEDDWIRRTILQNFHYLIMKNSWREEHDWIHRKDDGTLENYRESIEKRKTVNIRVRDRDDAWAIKEFYENNYLKNAHPIVIVFPDGSSFNRGVEKLKSRTFVCLLELHFTLWLLINLERTYRQYESWTQEFIESRSKFVKAKCTKKYFMEDREEKLKQIALDLLGEPLRESISSPCLRKIRSYGEVVYNYVVPESIRHNVKQDLNILEKVGMVFGTLFDLLGKLEAFPAKNVTAIEKSLRKKVHYEQRQSAQAYQLEKRILQTIEEIKRNMAPPYKKPKRIGKLPRTYLKRKPAASPVQEKRLSKRTLFFYKAFVADDDDRSMHDDNEEMLEMSNIQDTCIPFYFDHFLRLHNYEPNYNFKTKVELMYGPEEKPFRYKKILPEVYSKMEAWESFKRKQMESNIKKTMNMYTDIQV